MAGAGRGRQAGKAGLATRAQASDLAAEDVDPHPERKQIRSLRNAVSQFPQPIKRLVCESVGNNGSSSRAPDTIISTIIAAYVASRAAHR